MPAANNVTKAKRFIDGKALSNVLIIERSMIHRTILSFTFFTALLSAQNIVINSEKPDAVIAYVNGKPITQAEFQQIALSVDPKVQEAMKGNPEEFLRYFGFMDKLVEQAKKEQLEAKEPYKTKMRMMNLQILSEAMMQEQEYTDIVTGYDQEQFYKKHADRYNEANAKLIYVSFSDTVTELKAKQRITDLASRVKKGADFVALVKEFSEDEESKKKNGDFTIHKTDQIPDTVKNAVFGLQKGQLTEPIKLPNGYYLFRLEELIVKQYKDVKDDIYRELKLERKNLWLTSVRNQVTVKAPDATATPVKPAQPAK